MRELDQILEGFVDREFESLNDAEKRKFAEFLELPDPDVHAYLVGRAEPVDEGLVSLLRRIRSSVSS